MKTTELKERIEKVEIKLTKIEKRIQKWQKENNKYELERAYSDKKEQETLLAKYQNLLNLEIAKENEFENNRIYVIWEFLLNWKNNMTEFIKDNLNMLKEYYKLSREWCEWHNYHSYNLTREEYRTIDSDYRMRVRQIKENIHPYTERCQKISNRTITIDEKMLDELLLKDCKAKYFQLVNEVSAITGVIKDASNLSIRVGELNGIIIGEKGKAKITTISAGGYNIQCFHFRTLVRKV